MSDNILWPDEIFQYLEQAHRLVFGYGYIPWEYRYAARSWLLPGFLAFWLWLSKVAGLGFPTFYVPFVKLVLCALSTTLIYSAYCLARNLAGRNAGATAALLVAGWYELIFLAHKPLTELIASYALVACLALATQADPGRRAAVLIGVLAGSVCVLRLQYSLAIVVVVLYGVRRWRGSAMLSAALALGFVVLLGGAVDRITWGAWFESVVMTYRLNALIRVSDWFGREPLLWYAGALTVSSLGLLWLPLSLGWIRRLAVSRLPVACTAVILVSHSLIGHKEYRFIIAAVPLAWIVAAILLERGIASGRLSQGSAITAVALFFAISAAGMFYRLPAQAAVYPLGPPLARQSNLTAYLRLSAEKNVAAVLAMDDRRFNPQFVGTGGYYYLHHDVPVGFPSELRSGGASVDAFRQGVTHTVQAREPVCSDGFMPLAWFGNLQICRRTSAAPAMPTLCLPATDVELSVDRVLSESLGPPRSLPGRCAGGRP
jgi:hypothetical protein